MDRTKRFLESIGMPKGDLYSLPDSSKDLQMVLSIDLKFPVFRAPEQCVLSWKNWIGWG